MNKKFSMALSLAVIAAMLITSLALADNVVNDIDAVGDYTFTAPGSATIGYKINPAAAGDPQSGCNASDGSPATVTLTIPAGVTASTTTLIFTACNAFQNVTFTSSTPGNYAINVSSISDSGAGSYNNQANFTLYVNAPPPPSDTTAPTAAPTLSGTPGTNSWYTSDVTVTWNWSDNAGGSGINSNNCPATSTSSGEGSLTVSADCYDLAGNKGTASVNVNVDKTAPTISFVGPSTSAWYNADVTANWSCTDATSGPVSASVSGAASGEGNAVPATGTCVDLAGLTASNTQNFKIDKTAPTATANAAPPANGFGWNNTSVTVSYSGNDGSGSGIAFCDAADVLSTEGAGQTASGTCTDNAGNVSAPATATINIDLTLPLVSLVGGPADGGTYYFSFVPAAPTCNASDTLSGLDGSCSVSGYSAAIGSHTVSATATDKAGNSASDSAAYTVNAWTLNGFYQPVDMNGVYNTVRNGSTVPLKFEAFAGTTELTATSIVKSFVQTRITCDTSATIDEIEVTSTGGTSLRYDATAGQFIQNWQTPRQAGACYRVTLTTQDGSALVAFFRLK
jgi:hypothetical protein